MKILTVKNNQMDSISQPDLYQMITYAIRKKIREVKLLYPETWKLEDLIDQQIEVEDLLADGTKIEIQILQLPLICRELLEQRLSELDLEDDFQDLKKRLKSKLEEVFLGTRVEA